MMLVQSVPLIALRQTSRPICLIVLHVADGPPLFPGGRPHR